MEPVLASIYPVQGAALPSILATAHLYGLSIAAAVLIILIRLLAAWYLKRLKSQPRSAKPVPGTAAMPPRPPSMQYTASSFAEMLVGIFGGILRPERHQPDIKGLFPGRSSFGSHVPEVVLDNGILPFFAALDRNWQKYGDCRTASSTIISCISSWH